MQIQINTDHQIEGNHPLAHWIQSHLEDNLSRFGSQITRVEVHLSDENGHRAQGPDKRCLLEARMVHHQPVSTSSQEDSMDQAVKHACDKLVRVIESTLGKLRDRRPHQPRGEPEGPSSASNPDTTAKSSSSI